MKKMFCTLALAAASFGALAQTAPAPTPAAPAGYSAQLGPLVAQVTATGDAAELRALASKLERAAAAAPTDWLPRYYQAYALTVSAFQAEEPGSAKDKVLDQAEAALAQAGKLKGDESELLALHAYIYQGRLTISPMERGQEYSELIAGAVGQAEALNPANPRPYLIQANTLYYTPAEFGGGPAAAKGLYDTAKAKFAAFRPASALAPNWGERQLLGRLQQYAPVQAAK
ncbi:MAG: hypothetical protein ACRYG7_20730 [Janthinobacterium lividum]